MKRTVNYINEIGKKSENQDAVFPFTSKDAASSNLFLVCDGVGGSAHGEVASTLVCEGFDRYFKLHPGIKYDEQFIQEGLEFVRHRLVAYAEENPETEKMATTLTLLYLEEGKGAHISWIGDSRIYHFRKDKIEYVTKDHSLGQKLIDEGELTEETAKDFKQKNIILRAIHATLEPLEMSYHFIPNDQIEEGDIFMLCSDGVMEAWTDQELKECISGEQEIKAINQAIADKCLEQSRDNYSAYLIGINEVIAAKTKRKIWPVIIIIGFVIILLSVLFVIWSQQEQTKPIEKQSPIELPVPDKIIEKPDTNVELIDSDAVIDVQPIPTVRVDHVAGGGGNYRLLSVDSFLKKPSDTVPDPIKELPNIIDPKSDTNETNDQ
ncbi:MAG: serine/threonine-protein phosphatase [Flavobacteriales bacterium]|nr:serine/threonine-protein phosphatase [Flavobacteriales bacterium]